jgi:hypothetical protein
MSDSTQAPDYSKRIATIPRFRRPKLGVFGAEPPPRHETAWSLTGYAEHIAVRFWTEAEWNAVPEYARPEDTQWLSGVGWFGVDAVTKDEHKRIHARVREEQEDFAFLRGVID